MKSRTRRALLGAALVLMMVAGIFAVVRSVNDFQRKTVTAYFANTNGMFVGDEVRILGVAVGRVDKIEPQPLRAKVTFSYGGQYRVPADAKAVVLSPSLVTSRAIQLTPAYTGGPEMQNHAVIPLERTAVPVEYDDYRVELEKLAKTLQPTQPGGVSTLGALVNTAADNLRGEGANIRNAVIELSEAVSALGDRSTDLFSAVKNLSLLVTALRDSTDVLRDLNQNLAAVTGLLADDPNKVGQAVSDIDTVADDVRSFVAENREPLGTTFDKLASVTQALVESEDDIKQALHVAPNGFQNFANIYQPAQGAIAGTLATTMFANPIQFLCGAIQAASRLNAEQSSKLCVQYLAPIIKNRQYNFWPIGENLFLNAKARPNEITYSEDWLRPDHVPPPRPDAVPPPPNAAAPAAPPPTQQPAVPLASPTPEPQGQPTDPAAGLTGIMVPPGGAS
jgi:phospholipid/cholesterol/gamma-HCH transport system substrate-binding protein